MLTAAIVAVLFTSPLAALGVAGAAAAVPIVIHLLNRKRFVVVPWAAMRFLMAAQKKNVRRLKLEQWLLLAIRTALVILIALAMAAVMPWFEPIWQRLFPGETLTTSNQGRTHRIIVIDASFAMAARRPDESTRFDAAKAQAKQVLEKSGPGDGYSLIVLTSPAQAIIPGPVDDREKVAREIEALKMPHAGSDVPGGVHAVAELANKPLGKYARREVYFISDMRRSAWPMPQADAKSEAAPAGGSGVAEDWRRVLAGSRVAFIDVATQDQENIAVTGLTVGDAVPLANTDIAVQATIQNYGKRPRENLAVELLIARAGEKFTLRPVAQELVDVPGSTSRTVTFALDKQNRLRTPGQYVLQVRISEDGLPLDDARSMVVRVRDSIQVMVVNGKPSPDPLDRASGFLVKALNPNPNGELSPDSPAAVRTLLPREFQDAGLGDLFRPDAPTEVVFLCDVPTIGGNEAARLESHLKRGGSVVFGLGPNSAKNIEAYNRVLFDDGKGMLPGPLVGVRRAGEGHSYTLLPAQDAFKQPPLSAFRSEREQGSFLTPRFGRYLRVNPPANSPARTIFSFLPSDPKEKVDRLDPAIIEIGRHRGRVVVINSTFNEDWNDWGKTLSYPLFMQELLRHLVGGNARQTVQAGEPLDEYVPSNFVGLTTQIAHDDGTTFAGPNVIAQDEAGLVRVPNVERAGVYRVSVGGKYESLFAANVPTVTAIGGAESDLRRWTGVDLRSLAPDADLQVVNDSTEIQARATSGTGVSEDIVVTRPRGPAVARVVLILVLILLACETVFAWKFGSARAGASADPMRTHSTVGQALLWFVPFSLAVIVVGVIVHAAWTGEFLGFLPDRLRTPIERAVGVPAAVPGEGTRWRLETAAYMTGDSGSDQWLTVALVVLAGLFVWRIYRREKLGASDGVAKSWWRKPLVRLGSLRLALGALMLLVLMPQARLAFEREGWPDVVIMFDESRSMSVNDQFRDPVVKARVEAIRAEWTKIAAPRVAKLKDKAAELNAQITRSPNSADAPRWREEMARVEARAQDLLAPHRLNLVKAILATGDGEFLYEVLGRRQMRVHIYRVSGQATRIAELNDPEQRAQLLEEIFDVMPTGETSQLGTGVEGVLRTFRGGSLNALVLFTDGVNTRGDDLPTVARSAARAAVPLYLIGVGDASEPPDLILSDLRAEDSINVNDRLVMEARVSSQGAGMPDSIPVVLSEMKEGKPVEIAREMVRLDSEGKPVKVRFVHQPKEAGEKTFVIEIPTQADEADITNNRIEHRVFVATEKRLRVLLVEGRPRYDFRYIKALFERETEAVRGNKSIDVDAYLVSAHPDHPKQDRTAINRFPTPEELRKYDVVILGDVSPKQLPRAEANLDALAKFVKEQGGGLIMLAGEHANPHSYRDTPLADIMPVICDGPTPEPAAQTIRETYRPRLTQAGQSHPLFKFATDEAESIEAWNNLQPLYWSARGYRRKLSAEVLAVHPDRPAEQQAGAAARDENHPLVLQQFVGAGRVLFLGFDDTWRWRLRESEPRFNQFWSQAIRACARGRVGRIEVRTDRKTYRRDDPIQVTVRFPDDAPPPSGPVRVTVDRSPGKFGQGEPESQTLVLTPREGTRATYESLLTRSPEGDYSFTLTSPDGVRPKAEARVLPPPGELDRTQLNERDLQKAAQESRGAYFTIDRADLVPSELPAGARVALDQPCEPFSMWNHWSSFLLILGLLTAEWVIRKKWRLL